MDIRRSVDRGGRRRARGTRAVPLPRGALLLFCAVPLLAALAGCEGAPAAAGAASGYGYVCHAGFYQCTLPAQYPIGDRCQCPGLGAPSYGRVG